MSVQTGSPRCWLLPAAHGPRRGLGGPTAEAGAGPAGVERHRPLSLPGGPSHRWVRAGVQITPEICLHEPPMPMRGTRAQTLVGKLRVPVCSHLSDTCMTAERWQLWGVMGGGIGFRGVTRCHPPGLQTQPKGRLSSCSHLPTALSPSGPEAASGFRSVTCLTCSSHSRPTRA